MKTLGVPITASVGALVAGEATDAPQLLAAAAVALREPARPAVTEWSSSIPSQCGGLGPPSARGRSP